MLYGFKKEIYSFTENLFVFKINVCTAFAKVVFVEIRSGFSTFTPLRNKFSFWFFNLVQSVQSGYTLSDALASIESNQENNVAGINS